MPMTPFVSLLHGMTFNGVINWVFIAILLMVTMAFSFVACENTNNKPVESTPSATHNVTPSTTPNTTPTATPYNTPIVTPSSTVTPTPKSTPTPITTPTPTPTPAHVHSFNAATCTSAEKCSCGATNGKALGHSYSNGICSRCNSADPNYNPISLSKQNALKSAKSYLKYSAFSYLGLIEQLEYEKFPYEDAVYGADNCGADWNEQALKSAKSYLKYSSFSYSGLIEQLEYEKFTSAQAKYGVDNCGADWNAEAVEAAKDYLDYSGFSYTGLIEQLEYECVVKEDGSYEKIYSPKYKKQGVKIQPFTQDKPLYPAVGTPGHNNVYVYFDQLDKDHAAGGLSLYTDLNNIVDKFVLVKNTGNTDVYFRTIYAFKGSGKKHP